MRLAAKKFILDMKGVINMPISLETFDSGGTGTNPKLLEFFVKNRGKAYSLKELQEKFGNNVSMELLPLLIHGNLESKFMADDFYYCLRRK